MGKNILTVEDSIRLSEKLKQQDKQIILVGGVFDILHIGHLKFLINAKKQGNVLFVLLENDENVRRIKGENRPINPQGERAELLSHLSPVDYVILLPKMRSDKSYDKLIARIKPDVLAITQGDPEKRHKERQGKMVNAKVKTVIKRLENKSTTNLNSIIKRNS